MSNVREESLNEDEVEVLKTLEIRGHPDPHAEEATQRSAEPLVDVSTGKVTTKWHKEGD